MKEQVALVASTDIYVALSGADASPAVFLQKGAELIASTCDGEAKVPSRDCWSVRFHIVQHNICFEYTSGLFNKIGCVTIDGWA